MRLKGKYYWRKSMLLKKRLIKKIITSYCIVQISSTVDENTSSHNIIWWDGYEFWSIWKTQKGLCDEPILFHEQNVILICTYHKNVTQWISWIFSWLWIYLYSQNFPLFCRLKVLCDLLYIFGYFGLKQNENINTFALNVEHFLVGRLHRVQYIDKRALSQNTSNPNCIVLYHFPSCVDENTMRSRAWC